MAGLAVTARVVSSSPEKPTPHFPANQSKSSSLFFVPRRGSVSRSSLLTINCSTLLDTNATLLQAASKHTVDNFVKSGMVVGLGSGAASSMAIQYLGSQLRLGALKDVVGIPTSVSSASEAEKAGIPLNLHPEASKIDFAFNDVDIIEEGSLISVIGRRRLQADESIIHEKAILNNAEKLVFMVTEKHYRSSLEGSVPVFVNALNWMEAAEEIEDIFLGDAEVWRRSSIGNAGPTGGNFPVITREGHNIVDVIFTSPIMNLGDVAKILGNVYGVVDHGIVSKIPCTAVIASEDGINVVENPPADEEKESS